MNELIDSEPEIYGGDYENSSSGAESLDLSETEQEIAYGANRKKTDAKINNSFTGPYPLDPTDFNHTDKGPNFQFAHLIK